jgi:pantoate--beta-alanine ligase
MHADGNPSVSLPRIVSSRGELRARVRAARHEGKTIGVVPTMGALHAGHVSLVKASVAQCGFTVVTIFVNPTQFGPKEDFRKYPRTLDRDLAALSGQRVDLVFAPSTEEIYRPGNAMYVEPGGVALPLEGQFRPGHFRGVATVVLKLFNLVQPDVAFFGRKDFQQSLVVRQLVHDFDLPIEIRICPIVREPDGLAMSSRNAYLSADDRRKSLVISRSLKVARDLVAAGQREAQRVLAEMRAVLATEPDVRVEYLVLADPDSLAEVEHLRGPVVALIAAFVGATRLIDNQMLGEEPSPAASTDSALQSKDDSA